MQLISGSARAAIKIPNQLPTPTPPYFRAPEDQSAADPMTVIHRHMTNPESGHFTPWAGSLHSSASGRYTIRQSRRPRPAI